MGLLELTIIAATLLTMSGTVYTARTIARRRSARWVAAARAAGLEDIETSSSAEFLTARAGRHPVSVEEGKRGKAMTTRLVIAGNSGLTLRAEKDVSAPERAAGPREIEIGDEGFDNAVYVEGGDPAVLRAVLDLETRGLLRRFLGGILPVVGGVGGRAATCNAVHGGSVFVEVRGAAEKALRASLADVIPVLLEVARHLQRPAGIVERLVENTLLETHWRPRMENIKVLAEMFPEHPATRPVLLAGCDDEHPAVQLVCALALGADDLRGRATLLEIASHRRSGDHRAARAVLALATRLEADETDAILHRALRERSEETARACLEVLGASGWPPAVETLAKVMNVEKGDLAVTAAQALGTSGREAAQPPLLKALTAGDPDLRLAAVEALGVLGTADAVLPLTEAAERDGGLRRAVRQAIAEIQSRLGASPGQLSLAGGESGTLTLAGDGVEGRLSMEKPGS